MSPVDHVPSSSSIRWNKLHLDIPEEWEVIVKSTHHLIFEENLKPLFEIRWQAPLKRAKLVEGKDIFRQLEPGDHYSPHTDATDLLPSRLTSRFNTESYYLESDPEQVVLLLTCKDCHTVLLVRIYSSSDQGLKEVARVLASLNCHPTPEERNKWQILDFQFSVPEGFELERSTFRFGLTMLEFKSGKAELHLCRLAPASHHLQQSSLADLFHSFSSAPPELQTTAAEDTLTYDHVPSMAGYLWSKIRRKKVYQVSRFVHYPLHDRILGYSIRSRKPIEAGVEKILKNGYGIVQEEEKASGLDA